MRQSTFLILLLSLALYFTGCSESELVEGVDAGEVIIKNTSNNELSVNSNGTLQIEYSISPREGTSASEYTEVSFSSSDKSIFEIDSNGIITGKRNGTARLIVVASINKDENHITEVKGSCVVRVTGQKFVEKIDLDVSLHNLVINVNETSEFMIEKTKYSVYPADALITDVGFASSNPSVASVDENGLITAISGGSAIISIMSTDGSNVKAEISVKVLAPIHTWYLEERRSFEFDYRSALKYPLNPDGTGYGNNWKYINDEGTDWQASFISLTKPGKSGVPNDKENIFIEIDMKNKLKLNQIFIHHRSSLGYARLRVWEFDLHGSEDGETFELLEEKVVIPGAKTDNQNYEATILFDSVYEYRYIKIVPSDWDSVNGNTMQISDLKIGYDEARDPEFGK